MTSEDLETIVSIADNAAATGDVEGLTAFRYFVDDYCRYRARGIEKRLAGNIERALQYEEKADLLEARFKREQGL